MSRYIDADRVARMARAKADTLIEGKEAFHYIAKWLDLLPAADVVEVDTVKAWLYEMAFNNVGTVLDGDFSTACEEIIARLDGLRKFAQEK